MIDLGTVRPGTTLYIPFQTFDSNDPSASVTITGLATTDIEVYKDGSTTQRASDSGYALLDTDGIDFDAITGIHGFSIDLADNTTAGFWAAGSQYWVVVSAITVDAATISFVAATFRIGYPDTVLNTTIATLASQTSFTLTNGPAEDDALNGCVVCIHDVASAIQLGFAVISDYTGATKTVTLTAGVTFTAAAADNIAVFPPANTRWLGATAQTGLDVNDIESRLGTPSNLGSGATVAANLVDIEAQTDDIGVAGAGLTNINLPDQTMNITGDITGNLSGSVGSLTTNNDKTGYRLDATGSAALTEGYAADGATATVPQLLYMILALLSEFSVSGTTVTAKKLDGSTTAGTFTLSDGTNPTSITRAS